MSEPPIGPGEERMVRCYRNAVETVDERPSPEARAAILAAAAREIGARPQSADAPARTASRRWPLAAAAAVLLSTLAVLLAERTERELPSFTEPLTDGPRTEARASAQSDARTNAPLAATSAAAPAVVPPPASAPPVPTGAASTMTADAATAPRPQAPARQMPAERSADSGPAAATRETTADLAKQTAPMEGGMAAAPAANAAAAAAPKVRGDLARAPSEVGGRERDTAQRGKEESERKLTVEAAAPSGAASRLEAAPDSAAAEWLKRIIELRTQGRADEADAELRKFRQRYPEVAVPPAAIALPPR